MKTLINSLPILRSRELHPFFHTYRDLHMFRFMVTFVSCFTIGESLQARAKIWGLKNKNCIMGSIMDEIHLLDYIVYLFHFK